MEFGIAAGVLQVAGAGLQLAKTLNACATSFRDAKKDITAVAAEVALTASALQNLGHELEKDQAFYSDKLVQDVRAAMSSCEDCFKELEALVKGLVIPSPISVAVRARWVLSKGKIKSLKGDLSQHKITLTLMLEILGCAARQASRYVQGNNQITLH